MKLENIFPNIINMTEAFNTSFDKVEWEKFNDALIAKAKLGSDIFHLYIEPAKFMSNENEKTWLNIGFSRLVDGQLSQELINTGKNQSKQIGAIVNTIKDKLAQLSSSYDIDAIVFIVEKGQEKRISFYKKIMLSKVYGLRPWQYRLSIEWFGGTALIATKDILPKDELISLQQEIETRRKILTSSQL